MANEAQLNIRQPNWWYRRTTLEKALIAITIISLICIILLAVCGAKEKKVCESKTNNPAIQSSPASQNNSAFPIANKIDTNKNGPQVNPNSLPNVDKMKNNSYDGVCLTHGCVRAAFRILDQMDETVKPCEDFYNFACGKFMKETIIPDDKVSVNIFSMIGDKLQKQLRSLISEPVDPYDSAPFNMAKNVYKACINTTRIEELGLKPMIDIMEKLGGWPVLKGNEWDPKSEWSWTWAVKRLRETGFVPDYIFKFFIATDLKNSSARIINIDRATLSLSRNYLSKGLGDKIVKAYYEYMVDVAVIFGADRNRAGEELKESLEFERKLSNIFLPNEDRRNATAQYNPFTLKEVQEKYPYIQWVDYINALLPSQLLVDENEIIVVRSPYYFKKLGELLQEIPNRNIANYIVWRAVAYSSLFLTNEIRKKHLDYEKAAIGKQAQKARWQECIDITTGSFSMAVGALYVRKYFREDSKAAALEMVNGIQKEFETMLNDVKWMDNETRQSALNKLKAMSTHIGYPDEIMNDAKIEKQYENLKIDENNYLTSVLNMNVFGTDFAFNKLRKPVNKTDWITHARPAIVNAFYSPIENSIQFPAGILQDHFFSADRPRYLNYGAIALVIGHEITHGFDDQGSQFDLNGNLVNWWQSTTKANYTEKAKCIIDQYGNYTEPSTGLKLNGNNTLDENIADNGGVKEAYRAYRKWAKYNKPEPKLPGLKYSPQQMFWISAAQNWCTVSRPESMRNQILGDGHPPSQFRVAGPFRNRPEFANDFNCPIGSPMNPAKKCEVW